MLDAEAISICKRVRKHEQTALKGSVLAAGRMYTNTEALGSRGSAGASSDNINENTHAETVTVSPDGWGNTVELRGKS